MNKTVKTILIIGGVAISLGIVGYLLYKKERDSQDEKVTSEAKRLNRINFFRR